MDFLRKVFILSLIVLSFGVAANELGPLLRGNCEEPLKYSIGRVDNNFGISKAELLPRLQKAEKVWEDALGVDLFQYDVNAEFSVNLIYDERQSQTKERQKAESGFTEAENILKKLDADFLARKREYERLAAAHQEAVRQFEQSQKSYTEKVEYWNKKGGAPRSEYQSLSNESVFLNAEANRINQETSNLNQKAQELNALLQSRNSAAKAYNDVVKAYNQRYGGEVEFDQAVYTGDAINIYQFETLSDLDLALAHEFGHALQMEHVDTQESIMYYISREGTEQSLVPSPEDLAELKRVCKIK